MKTGIVKIWQKDRGYGYITPDDGSADVFVHFNGIEGDGFRALTVGQHVGYVLVAGYQDWQAARVHPIEASDGR
ncbi:cold-shock protein [Convivina intestini]|uniref:Putative cold-shock DNA-binding protein n=1 Tax=Convivina intestini TaxID=1505726 RepID=A0A2U1DBZ4_9LACO|nr:cold-shock protein [Convivina intestini]PVY85204.1 putative cold-shock DNA-binding protein [Convivina intestini]CAH1852414.1 Cold shock protein CspA [Convivina intestini]CAH1854582.1 Cold shock protein CspA [Convivina intestini]SDC00611.1 cold shock protein (beta-ribbon, CspA family) [Leuconostocaceae bacterium R-53105]